MFFQTEGRMLVWNCTWFKWLSTLLLSECCFLFFYVLIHNLSDCEQYLIFYTNMRLWSIWLHLSMIFTILHIVLIQYKIPTNSFLLTLIFSTFFHLFTHLSNTVISTIQISIPHNQLLFINWSVLPIIAKFWILIQ